MHIAPTGGTAGTGVSEAKFTPTPGQTVPVAGASGSSSTTPAQQAVLTDTAVIRELAVSDLLKLTQILQPTLPPERVARVEQLVQETVQAISEGRREWAVGRFIEVATTDPARVDELRANPEFEPIQPNVDALLNRLTNVAKMDAETKLASAEQTLENGGWQKLPQWETSPQALIQIGHRLVEAGGYVNYVRTAELASTLQTAYWSTNLGQIPLDVPPSSGLRKDGTTAKQKAGSMALAYQVWGSVREKLPPHIETLWRRAPLLLLLGSWFAAGLVVLIFSYLAKEVWPDSWVVEASDFGLRVWGVGLLAIVGFGFWARLRRAR